MATKNCEECNKPITDNGFKSNVWEEDHIGKRHQVKFCSKECRDQFVKDCADDLFLCPECNKIIYKYRISFGRNVWSGKFQVISDDVYVHVSNGNVQDAYHCDDDDENIELICKKCADKMDLLECDSCSRKVREKDAVYHNCYDRPWDDEERQFTFCSEACEQATLYENDFAYFTCERCDREICEQNPSNGWMTQYRHIGDEMVCLRCFEEEMFENGLSDDELEEGKLNGMFLNDGDANAHGFKVFKYLNHCVRSRQEASQICDDLLQMKRKGYKVLIEYDSMAIGGSEGYITTYIKMDEKHKDEIFQNLINRIRTNDDVEEIDEEFIKTFIILKDKILEIIETEHLVNEDTNDSIKEFVQKLREWKLLSTNDGLNITL